MAKLAIVATCPSEGFVETSSIKRIVNRALSYLKGGFAVHFSGPTGTGKTTLAMHLANLLEQPVMLIFGDEEFGTSDLVGDQLGYRKRKLIDNFIHSVLKTEEDVMTRWVDNRLTTAVKHGFTFLYDEFNRSRPEANNALLSVLEEGILTLPASEEEKGYAKVHPNFHAIFTSNPEEYAGVHKTQDALLDRMVTIHLGYFDEETERKIVERRTGVSSQDVRKIVSLIRALRRINDIRRVVTIRPAIVIGTIVKQRRIPVDYKNPLFREICQDALTLGRYTQEELSWTKKIINRLIDEYCNEKPGLLRPALSARFAARRASRRQAGKKIILPSRDSGGRFVKKRREVKKR